MVTIATARSSVHDQHSNDIEGDSDKANIVGWAAALEAMAEELPVIATSIGGLPEVVGAWPNRLSPIGRCTSS